jgi:pyruvate dehydrogenase E2 component (dihydrolipoamide acetyltransferase)
LLQAEKSPAQAGKPVPSDRLSQGGEGGGKVRATPLVRKLAAELGVDLAAVAGTGPHGRITDADVRAAGAPAEGRREPLRGIRRQMFEHLTRAHREIPAVTWVEECDFTHVDLRLLVPLVLKAVAESLRTRARSRPRSCAAARSR